MVRINAPDLVRRIRERYGIRGPEGIEALAPEIVPVALVDIVEAAVPTDQHRYSEGTYIIAVGAQYCAIQLEMPAATGRIAVITSYTLFGTANSQVYHGIGTSQLATAIASAENRDRRDVDHFFAAALMRHTTAVGGAWGTFLNTDQLAGGVHTKLRPDVVLRPGDWYTFRGAAVNQPLGVQLEWYEAPYEA